MDYNELRAKIKGLDQETAIKEISEYINLHPDDDRALTLRGMKHWGAGHRSLAIGDYLAALRINPRSSASEALKATNEILDYRNKDLYNP